MATNPRASVSDLARRSGLSPRTARQRRNALLEPRRALVIPKLEYGASPGVVLFDLLVRLTHPIPLEPAENLVPSGAVLRMNPAPPAVFLLCAARSVQEIADTEYTVRQLPDVRSAIVRFPRQRAFAVERLGRWIDEKCSATRTV